MLLVLAQTQSLIAGLVYLGVFGVGTIFGMVLMSGLVGLPFVLTRDDFPAFITVCKLLPEHLASSLDCGTRMRQAS